MIKKLTCIVCPNGCEIEIDGDSIKGYTCKRGLEYAKEELFHPHLQFPRQQMRKYLYCIPAEQRRADTTVQAKNVYIWS